VRVTFYIHTYVYTKRMGTDSFTFKPHMKTQMESIVRDILGDLDIFHDGHPTSSSQGDFSIPTASDDDGRSGFLF